MMMSAASDYVASDDPALALHRIAVDGVVEKYRHGYYHYQQNCLVDLEGKLVQTVEPVVVELDAEPETFCRTPRRCVVGGKGMR